MKRRLLFSILVAILTTATFAQAYGDEEVPTNEDDPEGNFWINMYDPIRLPYEKALKKADEAMGVGQYDRALDAYEEALGLIADAPGYNQAARAAELGENWPKARTYLEQLKTADADADTNYSLCFRLALTYSKLDEFKLGVAEYERCLKTLPGADATTMYANMAELNMASGDLAGAIEDYRQAVYHNPGNPHANFGLAVALDRNGDIEESRQVLRTGLNATVRAEFMFAPGTFFVPDGEIHYHLAIIERERGRIVQAREQMQRYLDTATKGLYRTQAEARLEEYKGLTPYIVESYPLPTKGSISATVDPKLANLAIGTSDGKILVANLKKNDVVEHETDGRAVLDLAYNKKGTLLRALLSDGTVLTLDVKKKLKRKAKEVVPGLNHALNLSADGSVVIGDDNYTIKAYKLGATNTPVATMQETYFAPGTAAAITDDGKHILSTDGSSISITNTESKQPWQVYLSRYLVDVEAIPGGGGFLVAQTSGASWLHTDGTVQRSLLPGSFDDPTSVSVDASGRYAIIMGATNVEVWDLKAMQADSPAAKKDEDKPK